MTAHQECVVVDDDSRVGEARRLVASLGRRAGLPEAAAGRAAIVINELATNLRKHARSGELLLSELHEGEQAGLEIVSVDNGPGMNLDETLRDGFSTAGTRGEGLGAVRRQSDVFDAWSASGQGTVVAARIWGVRPGPPAPIHVSAVNQALRGEAYCGDAWDCERRGGTLRVLVVDGLGHGPIAARAADEAVKAFRANANASTVEALVRRLHEALRPTRGGAVAVTEVDLIAREVRFCGVGNVAAAVDAPGARGKGLVSHNGIAGHEARRIQEFRVPWPAKAVLVMHSDGIATSYKLEAYPGLLSRHPSVIAAILYRDYRRPSDDATVVVAREP